MKKALVRGTTDVNHISRLRKGLLPGVFLAKQSICDADSITLDPICAAGIDTKSRHGHLVSVKGKRLGNKPLRVICAIEL